ncbi:MAG TPA: XdhC family protein [Steroidobacteraceae bacterium]|nr:XdhC family protein [Steroidobacteraceae bacterium]
MINSINNAKRRGGNRGVLAAAADLMNIGEPFALAIVTGTQGSTYRKSGALALYSQQGASHSVISGGCLEPQWHNIAATVIADHQAVSLTLDTQTDDDLIFGSGSGCRGLMRIMIIPVHPDNAHPAYSAIAESHQQGIPLRMMLMLDQPYCGQGLAWNGNKQWAFSDHANVLKNRQQVDSGEHQIQLRHGKSSTIAVLDIRPAPRIALIGASVETTCLLRFTQSLGWQVTVIDHRAAPLQKLEQDADEIVHARPAEWLNKANRQSFDAVLIMSHSASIDLEALRAVSMHSEPYVGLLGPPARRDELLAQLTEQQRQALLPRLHAPLGLRLGGDGPEPLALSIAAELQRTFSQ